jgi:O-antigen/teichoic acid export membrane protein
MVILSPIITYNFKNSLFYLLILSVQLISLFLFEILRIYIRLINLNKLYAKITIIKTLTLVLFSLLLTLNFSGIGYVISFALVPLIISLFFIRKLKLINKSIPKSLNFNLKEFISYGMFSSFAGVLSQLLFAVDILLITNILRDETLVAQYKTATFLPFSFLFLSVAFIRTNFVKIANKSLTDKNYIKHYYLNYLKIFSVLSTLIILFFYFFSDYIFLFFGKQYNNDYNLMFVFSIGIAGSLLLRTPLGNLLSAVGWPKINALNSFIVLICNVILNYILIHKMGIIGAAIATTIMFWFSGVLSLIAFIWYLKSD